ncbi:MAG: sulfotransferase family protein [Candidatus Heimdallarchaeaceae archaeon]
MHSIKKRVFIVGCPRSGTTLVQSLLAAHESIESFPESHFFISLMMQFPYLYLPKIFRRILKNSLILSIAIAHPRINKQLENFFSNIGLKIGKEEYRKLYTVSQYTKYFVHKLDEYTLSKNKYIWVEKTPDHLKYVEYIEVMVKEAVFIHVIRNGCDVIASLYDAGLKYPKRWEGVYTIDQCTQKWKKAIKLSKEYVGNKNHFFVRYEDIIKNPARVLKEICGFLKIQYSESMLNNSRMESDKLILNFEPWKESVRESIKNKIGLKFQKIFNEEEQRKICKEVSKVNVDVIFSL